MGGLLDHVTGAREQINKSDRAIIWLYTSCKPHNNRYLHRATPSVVRTFINEGPDFQIALEFGSVRFLLEGGKPENPEKAACL